MKQYNGAMFHGVNKLNVKDGETGERISLDLGMIPEEVIKEKVTPLITKLNDIFDEYKVYFWCTTGWFEDKSITE